MGSTANVVESELLEPVLLTLTNILLNMINGCLCLHVVLNISAC